jgi:LysR family transcriptional repressor of citA
LDLRLLQTFRVAARTGSFRKAADQLFLAQPTVTQQIKALEEALQLSLFERSRQRVRLSAAGERFLEHAERILASYEASLQEMAVWRQGYQERLSLAASPIIASTTLPRVVARFTAANPTVDVVIRIEPSEAIPALIASGQVDVGLARVAPTSRDLKGELWYRDEVLLVAYQDGGDIDAPPPDWRELLASNRLLTHNHPGYWDDLLITLYQLGIRTRAMRVGQVDVTKKLIEEGLGLSFLPRSAVWRELVEGRLQEVPTPGLTLPVAETWILVRSDSPPPAAVAFSTAATAQFP